MAPIIGTTMHFHCPNEEKVKPAIVVDVFNETTVNLQVFDGTGTHLETSVTRGDGHGMWQWPPIFAPPEV